ncbi:MAG: serine/threonine-protein kinase [Polyangiaceae bacterium]
MDPLATAATLSTTTPSATDPEIADHAAALVRARRFAVVATAGWTSSVYLDVICARQLAPAALRPLLMLRLLGTIVTLAAWGFLRARPKMSPLGLRILLVASFATITSLLGVMGSLAGGLMTPLAGGAIATLGAFAAISHVRWTRGLLDFGIVTATFFVALLVSTFAQPAMRAQLSDPHTVVYLKVAVTNALVFLVIAAFGAHVAWSLRRQVFEARSLGRYKLRRRLGSGGMGEVWLAHHHGLKRDVAVKILRTDYVRDSQVAIARFEREVHATTELTHPNTVRVLDYGATDDGLFYYAMELLSGENLADLIDREGPQPVSRAVRIVTQAARALAEAHSKGIVHRDVKPENLFLTTAGGEPDFVKVVDFGIARLPSSSVDVALTRDDAVLGSPRWLSPEGFASKALGPPADVYGLGEVLFLLLSGAPPFEGDSVMALAHAHLHGEAPALPPSVPADVRAIVERCMRKDPSERYSNAAELTIALCACEASRMAPVAATGAGSAGAAATDPLARTEGA